jgi:hypothetical protein
MALADVVEVIHSSTSSLQDGFCEVDSKIGLCAMGTYQSVKVMAHQTMIHAHESRASVPAHAADHPSPVKQYKEDPAPSIGHWTLGFLRYLNHVEDITAECVHHWLRRR